MGLGFPSVVALGLLCLSAPGGGTSRDTADSGTTRAEGTLPDACDPDVDMPTLLATVGGAVEEELIDCSSSAEEVHTRC